jgi:hypothetical protein
MFGVLYAQTLSTSSGPISSGELLHTVWFGSATQSVPHRHTVRFSATQSGPTGKRSVRQGDPVRSHRHTVRSAGRPSPVPTGKRSGSARDAVRFDTGMARFDR